MHNSHLLIHGSSDWSGLFIRIVLSFWDVVRKEQDIES